MTDTHTFALVRHAGKHYFLLDGAAVRLYDARIHTTCARAARRKACSGCWKAAQWALKI